MVENLRQRQGNSEERQWVLLINPYDKNLDRAIWVVGYLQHYHPDDGGTSIYYPAFQIREPEQIEFSGLGDRLTFPISSRLKGNYGQTGNVMILDEAEEIVLGTKNVVRAFRKDKKMRPYAPFLRT